MNIQQFIAASVSMDMETLKKEAHNVQAKYSQDPNVCCLLPLVVGTTLYAKAGNKATDEVIKYLQESVDLKLIAMNAYQLAYVLEERVRSTRLTKDEECKQMIRMYLACQEQEAKAACQLGSYLIDFPEDIVLANNESEEKTGTFVEDLLLSAHRRKVPQAITHLIRLYKRQKSYNKVVNAMKIKYLQTQDMMDLMELSLMLLNSADYFGYFKIMQELKQPVTSVKAFLKPGAFDVCVEKQECCVCLTEKNNVRTLVCRHYVCDVCLLNMFENNLRTCPQCRSNLCPDQTEEAKKCIDNMMNNDTMTKFTHSMTFQVKKA